MGINLKEKFGNGVANIQNAGKRALATLATVAALSGVLTSCNSPDVRVDGDIVSAGFEYIHSHGSADPDRQQFDVKIQKVGDLCIATLDGDGFDNYEFRGTSDMVFGQVTDFLLDRSRVTGSEEVADKTLDKIDQMRTAYDSIANLKK